VGLLGMVKSVRKLVVCTKGPRYEMAAAAKKFGKIISLFPLF
jgi:hypothetical protein